MFYFNVKKQVGYCHHDKCHWKPTLKDLVDRVGHGPDDTLGAQLPEPEPEPVEITLPEGAKRLIVRRDGNLWTDFPAAVGHIEFDRRITVEDQFRFALHVGNQRVYVPVYDDTKLVNYVGRAMWWLPYKPFLRYEYAKGVKTSNYLFNWSSAKTWNNLTLVENTFNAIAYKKECVTTNFGSHLSDKQINMITHGRARSVLLLWDEGADASAFKAAKKLRAAGVKADYAKINGQPDDHGLDYIHRVIAECHAAIAEGKQCKTYRK
jgi:hypothetical protein